MTKRVFDVLVSITVLLFLTPLLLFISAVLRLVYGSPLIFSQERVGRDGRLFTIHKFRTMSVADGPPITTENDPRIHGFGRFLRSSKADELPQLFDVLAGKMSLVGPRPELPEYVAKWSQRSQMIVLSVKPGITDPASVRYRFESRELSVASDPYKYYELVIMPRKIRIYEDYVARRSFLGDLRIILATVAALLRRSLSD